MSEQSKRVVVLFAGNAGHGKSLAGDILAEELHPEASVKKMAFADPIKHAAEHLLGIPKAISYGSQADKENFRTYGKTARHWLQWIGTELGREMIDKEIWVHRFAERALGATDDVVVGVDCRFNNEILGMRQLLADKMELLIVRIVNPRVPVNLAHRSESEVYEMSDNVFDVVIVNDESVDSLRAKLSLLVPIILSLIGMTRPAPV